MTDEDPGASMETLSDAIRRLQAAGWTGNWYSVSGGRLRCDEFELELDPSATTIDEIVRFEGASDPDDEAILYALSVGDGRRGLYSAAYGPNMSLDDVAVIRRLEGLPHGGGQ